MKTNSIRSKIEQKLNSSSDLLSLNPIFHKDHYTYELLFRGKKVTTFKISYTSREYGKRLIGIMSRQLGISSKQLKGIEKCTFWSSDFVENSRLCLEFKT